MMRMTQIYGHAGDRPTEKEITFKKTNEMKHVCLVSYLRASNMTKDQYEKLREVFALFDKEGNGCVEAKNLGAVFREMGQNPSEGALAEMLKEAGISDSGQVEFPTCCEMLQEHMKEQEQQQEDMRQAFRQLFDKENTGAVRASDLHATLTCMGEKISNDELDELIQLSEKNETGMVLIESLIDIMIAKPT